LAKTKANLNLFSIYKKDIIMATFTVDLLSGNIFLFNGNFSGSGSTPTTGSTYPQVNLYTDLPAAGTSSGKIYVVRSGSGTYVANRKSSGFYFSNGSSWKFLGDTPDYFKSNNFQIYDSVDNAKGVMFITSGISTNNFRNLTIQNSDGTLAYLTDLNTKVDVSVFNNFTGTTLPTFYYNKAQINSYTGKTNTLIGTKLNIINFNNFTGTTLPTNYYNKTQINNYTGSTGLQQVTEINASTNIESSFNGGLVSSKIRPTGDTVSAITINKADGITPIITINTISGLTGFGTITPKGLVHAYGIDTIGDLIGTETNALIIDGSLDVDKNVQWAENGVAKWLAETYRDENAKFWYLYNIDDNNSPIVISETGRFGVNSPSNIMNSHAALVIGGPNDISIGGIYTRNYISIFEFEIDSITGTTDTFRWKISIDQGQTFSAWSISSGCTTGATLIYAGITVQFKNITGHGLGTTFIFAAFGQLPIGTFVVSTVGFTDVQQTLDYTANPIIYNNITAEANSSTLGGDVIIFNSGTTVNAIYFGTQVKIDSIYVNMLNIASGIILVTEYWTGSMWVDINNFNNNYIDCTKNLTQSGSLSWDSTLMTNWIQDDLSDLPGDENYLYWIRIRTTTNPIIAPIANSFARGGNYRFAIMSSPNDTVPHMYVDSLGRVNIGGGVITRLNKFQINEANFLDVAVGSQSLIEMDSNNANAADLRIKLSSNDAIGTGLAIVKTRGTLCSVCGVQNGDEIGHVWFRARIANTGATVNSIISQYTGNGLLGSYNGDILFNTATNSVPTEKVRITAVGNTGFGIVPTAVIHLKAGTITNAPLKFTSGSLLSSPEVGAVEFDGYNFYFTITGSTIRKTFSSLESPIFTGNPELPVSTCLNNINLCNFILNSGGTNNNTLFKTCDFNAYTGSTQPAIVKVITGATNGICKYDNHNICLGGILTAPIIICGNQDFCLQSRRINIASSCGAQIYDKNGCGMEFYSSGGTISIKGMTSDGTEAIRFQLSNTQVTITDSRAIPRGFEYNNDYSSTFSSNSLVSRAYVDTVATGLQVHAAVEVATTGPVTLSGLTIIGGVQLTIGMRVLVKNQASGATNGVYTASTTNWGRASDFNGSVFGDVVSGAYMSVISGATNKNTSWILTTPNPIYIGITPLTFVLFNSTQGTVSGNGICVTSVGGNYNIAVKLASNSSLCSDVSGLYVNSAIAGIGLQYSTGVINLNGSSLAGNSICWSGNSFNVNVNSGTLSTTLTSKLNTSIYQTYTGTTAPATYASKSFVSGYTGITAPNTFASKSFVSGYTGTTAPNTFASKSFVSGYTGTTNAILNKKANISGVTFTGVVNVCTPATNDNSNCVINSAWYIGQCATAMPLMDGTATVGTSTLWAKQDHTHPSDTSKLFTSGGTMSGTLKGTIITGSTRVCSPIVCGTSCVQTALLCSTGTVKGTIITGSTRVCSPIVCGTSCVSGAIISGSTCMITSVIRIKTGAGIGKVLTSAADGTGCWCNQAASVPFCWVGTTANGVGTYVNMSCICSQPNMTFNGSTLSVTGNINASTYICSPIITGSTRVCSPIVCGTSCIKSPLISGGTSAFAPTPAVNNNSTCIATTAWYIKQGSTALPLMDSTATSGSSTYWSRQDHVHPSDTNKISLISYSGYTPGTGATVTIDARVMNHQITMPAGNITIAVSNATNGLKFFVHITQDGVGGRTVTWFSTIRWAGGTAPILTTTASKRDVLGFFSTSSNTYDGYLVGLNI
jgi:hypothetical protein